MIVIPFAISETEFSILIGLDEKSIERIRNYDPAAVIMSHIAHGGFRDKKLKDISITFASEDDIAHILPLVNNNKTLEALQYLTRGFVFRPDKGDYDGPPLNLRTEPGEIKQ